MAEGRAVSGGRQRFSIIPAAAVTDSRLEPRDLQVLCLLGRHTDDLGWCCRSQVKMAKELNCGRATVQRSLGRLVDAGYLEHRANQRKSGADAAHDYRVVIDPPEAPAMSDSGVEGVPIDGQGCPPIDGQGVPAHARAPMLTTPVKREREERESEREGREPADVDAADRPDRADFQKRVMRFCNGKGFASGAWKNWDTGAAFPWICRQFAALTIDERREAERWRDAYLFDVAERKKDPVAVGNFLIGRTWTGLDPALLDKAEKRLAAPLKPEKPAYEPPFGPVWFGRIHRQLVTGQKAYPPMKAWETEAIASGTLDRVKVERDLRRRGGWPVVNAMYRDAEQRSAGIANPSEDDIRVGALCEFVPVGTEMFAAWRRRFDDEAWPWPPHGARGAYFPAGGPERIDEFEAAVRGEDDAGGREAAE